MYLLKQLYSNFWVGGVPVHKWNIKMHKVGRVDGVSKSMQQSRNDIKVKVIISHAKLSLIHPYIFFTPVCSGEQKQTHAGKRLCILPSLALFPAPPSFPSLLVIIPTLFIYTLWHASDPIRCFNPYSDTEQ